MPNKIITRPAVIYARYSSANQREESIDGQIRVCKDYAKRNNFNIIQIYTDSALTGRSDKRPGFQQMIKDSERHQFSAVLVYKLDRFSRNRYDSAIYRAKLKKNGVQIYSAMEAIAEGSEGIILESLMEGLAEYYSANLSENVKRGNYESCSQHKTMGISAYGFRKSDSDTFEVNEDEARIVRRIFEEYAAGKTIRNIYTDLNNEGLRNSAADNSPFNKYSIRKILNNEKYIGTYIYGDYREENVITPIVDRDLFDKVQNRSKVRKQSPRSTDSDYLLTTKIFCGHCGSPMLGESTRKPNGNIYRYYSCKKMLKEHACNKKRVPKDAIEKAVIEHLTRLIHTPEFIDQIIAYTMQYQLEQINNDTVITACNKRLKQAENEQKNIADAIAKGIISDAIIERNNALNKEIAELQASIQKQSIEMPYITEDQLRAGIAELSAGDPDSELYHRHLINAFLKAVYVYDDGKIRIVLVPGGDEEITAEEIASEFAHKTQCPAISTICELVCIRNAVVIEFAF